MTSTRDYFLLVANMVFTSSKHKVFPNTSMKRFLSFTQLYRIVMIKDDFKVLNEMGREWKEATVKSFVSTC